MFCGIDPGRFKIGVAFAEKGELLFSAIVPKTGEAALCTALRSGEFRPLGEWCREGSLDSLKGLAVEKIFVGDGTSSADFLKSMEGLAFEVTDEHGTTLAGREIYWRLHPPRLLWRFVPTSLRTPPRDIDDLAAYCIIKR